MSINLQPNTDHVSNEDLTNFLNNQDSSIEQDDDIDVDMGNNSGEKDQSIKSASSNDNNNNNNNKTPENNTPDADTKDNTNAAQQDKANADKNVGDDELIDDQLEDPPQDKQPKLSIDPKDYMQSKFIKHTPILNANNIAARDDVRQNYETYDPNNATHKIVFQQCPKFNSIQWFNNEISVIIPPMILFPRKIDMEEDTFPAYLKAFDLLEVYNTYTSYLFFIALKSINPNLFEKYAKSDEFLRMISFAFRPQFDNLSEFKDYQLTTTRKIIVTHYLTLHGLDEAFMLIENVVNMQVHIVEQLCKQCKNNLIVNETLQSMYDYAFTTMYRAFVTATALINYIHVIGKGELIYITKEGKYFTEAECKLIAVTSIPDELLSHDGKDLVNQIVGTVLGKRNFAGNVSDKDQSPEYKRRKKNTKNTSFSRKNDTQHTDNSKKTDTKQTENTKMNDQQQPPFSNNNGQGSEKQPPSPETTPGIDTSDEDDDIKMNSKRGKKKSRNDLVPRELEKQRLRNIFNKYKFKFLCKDQAEALEHIFKVKDFKDEIESEYKGKGSMAYIMSKIELGITGDVYTKWDTFYKQQAVRNGGTTKLPKTVDLYTKWIIKELEFYDSHKLTYKECHAFRASTWKPVTAIDEFLLLFEKHKYTAKFASKRMLREFAIPVDEQIKIIFNQYAPNIKNFMLKLKQRLNWNRIDTIQAQLTPLGQTMDEEQLKEIQQENTWTNFAEFRTHAQMFEIDQKNKNNNVTYEKQVTTQKRKKKDRKRKTPKNKSNYAANANSIQQPSFQTPTFAKQQTNTDQSNNNANNRTFTSWKDPLYAILGEKGRYLKGDQVADYIRKNGNESVYRDMKCIRRVGKNKICGMGGHSAALHNGVMKVKGCAEALQRKFNAKHNDRQQYSQNNNGYGRGKGRGKGHGRGRGRGRKQQYSGRPRGRGRGRGRGKYKKYHNNDNSNVNIINVQPDGRDIFGRQVIHNDA